MITSNNNTDAGVSEVALREKQILDFWEREKIFHKTLQKTAPKGDFTFYDGPPFATGLPHYGHILASTIKDTVSRYRTMTGYRVPRMWGWDCHGLPIENIVEKELGIKRKKDIEKFGVAQFNERCREQVLTYAHRWEKIIPRTGRWVDMDHAYRTMDKPFMESVWWVFKQIYDKGLVYEDYRVMHICPRCETTLSQGEVSEGYKDVKDISVTVKFELDDEPGTHLLVWTTTPWTLPGNVAVAVGADIDYVKVATEAGLFILGKEAFSRYQMEFDDPHIVAEMKGSELVGRSYKPPFDYYVTDKMIKNHENGWKVYNADFVTAESGTGIAHEAPTFGADDWALLKKVNLPFVQHVTMDGTFKPEVKDFAGMEVKPNEDRTATDVEIIKHMSKRGTLFSKEKIEHSYPHCWRCDTPLLNYATSSWFVSVEKVKENLLKNAERITWSPAHIKEGRFGKWLEGARDWSISRQRFWASVIPIWICEKCKSKRVFGSAAELEEVSGKKIDDLHKHIVDEVTVMCECQGVMRRVPDVLDTWFDSGSMPYGERHYPFENKEQFDAVFPAQFIAEGVDQTRAWFYYLHVLGGALFSENAFQNVIVSGIVLAEDGKKMSKKLQNYPDPMEVIEKYGADAVRLYMLSSPVVRAESLNFTESGVGEIGRKVIDRLVNTYTFYALYKDAVAHTPHADSVHVLDRWIIARMQELSAEVTAAMDDYELDRAARPLIEFVDDLSTWYVRRSRDRFKGEDTSDASAALSTLSWVLREYAKHAAPFMPFITDWLWRELKHTDDVESVHLAHWPELGKPDTSLITAMGETRQVVSIALQQRAHVNMKVRQPLAKVIIPDASVAAGADREALFELIKDEVNVKAVETNTDKTFSVQLDTILTEDLIREGHIRDLLRAVQGLRKQSKLTPGAKAVLVARASTDALKTLVASAEPELARVANISEVQWLETSETHEDDESVKENTETIKFTDATLTITLK